MVGASPFAAVADDHHTVVGHDHVVGVDQRAGADRRPVHIAEGFLHRRLGEIRLGPDWKAHLLQHRRIAHAGVDDQSAHTPRQQRNLASGSPKYRSSQGLVGATTSTSPAVHCSTATWIIQLSPGATSQVTAEPAISTGRQVVHRWEASWPMRPRASCTVATPYPARRR
jgi:hypothetical protein